MKKLLLLLAMPILMSGCASQIGMLTVASSKNTDLKFKDEAKATVQVSAQASTLDKAIIKALDKAGSGYDALIDMRVDFMDYYFVYAYKVTGTPVKTSGVK